MKKSMRGTPEVPDGWQLIRLGDVADINRGISWSRDQESSIPLRDTVPVVRIGNVQLTGFQLSDILHIKDISSVRKRRFAVTMRTLVMVGSNGNRDRVGNAFLATPTLVGHLLASFLISIEPHKDMSEHFLSAILRSASIQQAITKSTSGSTGLKNLSLTWLRNLRLNTPPLPEQRAIAAVLDSIDEAIEKTEAVAAATERLRDALLHRLLTRGVPGWHSQWKEVRGIGIIPASWDMVRLGDVLESTTYGTNVRLGTKGATSVLRMNNLQNGKIDLTEVRQANLPDKELGKLDLVPGDILFNRTNSRDLVGKVAIVHTLPNSTSFASYLVRLRVRGCRANSFWLAALLHSPNCQFRVRRLATPGVSQANINPTSLKSLTIALPTLPEQRIIASLLYGVDEAIEQGRGEREILQSLKASAADALLTGRVRVKTS